MCFMSCRQYLSSVRFNLTTRSVVLMAHRALTEAVIVGRAFIELSDTKLTAHIQPPSVMKPPTLSTCLHWASLIQRHLKCVKQKHKKLASFNHSGLKKYHK